jgi:hypothetical protein
MVGGVLFRKKWHLRAMERRSRLGSGLVPVTVFAGAMLVFLSIAAQLGMGPLYLFRQFEIREAMERRILKGLPDEALSVLRFSDAEFEEVSLYDEGQELELDGSMYDIVSLERSAGVVIVKAVRDGDETRLNKDLDRMVRARLAADQRGRHERSCMVASWAPYCEVWHRIFVAEQPKAERCFGHLRAAIGRENGPIDPGPPRSA